MYRIVALHVLYRRIVVHIILLQCYFYTVWKWLHWVCMLLGFVGVFSTTIPKWKGITFHAVYTNEMHAQARSGRAKRATLLVIIMLPVHVLLLEFFTLW